MAVDDLGQTSTLIIREQFVKALVQTLSVIMAGCEYDAFHRQAKHILAALVHELADQGISGADVGDFLFDICALEVQLFEIDTLLD